MRLAAGVVAALALAVAAPTPSAASWPRAERARALATEWWHASPSQCASTWTVRAETDELPPTYWARFLAPVEDWVGLADKYECRVYLRRSWLAERPPWRMFCLVYLHEWGHLLGRDHPAEGSPLRNRYDRIMVPGTGFLPRACR